MSVTPSDFLAEAKAAAIRSDEIGRRQAISRGYYAAYHWAESLSGQFANPASYGRARTHQELIDRMQSVDRKKIKGGTLANQIAPLLARGRALRVKADYFLNEDIFESEARAAIAHAERVQALVAQLAALHTP